MNITDIDDKIIKNSIEQKVNFMDYKLKWEKSFFEDMASLNIEIPDSITRVTEFVDDVVDFIKQIMENGYAYEANGSVYFNVEKFKADGYVRSLNSNFQTYAKLEPTSANTKNKTGEVNVITDKKNPRDFALWKKAKEGEPKWPSPWSEGRPGWHIECSAMCHHAFQGRKVIDFHSGGVDLKFPHHDNELA